MKDGPILVAMTGASGARYGLRLVEVLLEHRRAVQVLLSAPARLVLATEEDLTLPAKPQAARAALLERCGRADGPLSVYAIEDWMSPVASGSNPPAAMVVCPCTTGTLGGIAAGTSRNLIERAADVVLKERRPLLLVPRETPLSVIHLENMLRLARAGAVILPPCPGFYNRPREIGELVDFVVARILDHLDIEHHLFARWGVDRTPPVTPSR